MHHLGKRAKKRVRDMIDGSGTVIMVSHSQGLMMEICDRIILMEKGEILAVGEPAEMYKKYNELLKLE